MKRTVVPAPAAKTCSVPYPANAIITKTRATSPTRKAAWTDRREPTADAKPEISENAQMDSKGLSGVI